MENYLKKELYELIRNDESIFDFIQESSLDGLWYWDLEKPENEWMNARFWTILGYNPSEMPHLSHSWKNIIDPDDLKIALDNFKKHLADPLHPYDQMVRYKHKNGSTVWIQCRGMIIRDKQGNATRMLGAHHDVTELKNAELNYKLALHKAEENEKLLKEKNEEIENFFNCTIDLFCIANTSGKFLRLNKEWENVLGYSILEIENRYFMEFVHPEDIEATQNILNQLNEQSAVPNFINRYRCKNGEYRWIEWKYFPKGEKIYATARDITERKKYENALAHSHDLLKYIVEHDQSAIAVFDRDLRYIYVSRRYLNDYKVVEKDIIGKYHYNVFPDLPQKWRDAHQKALEGIVSGAEDDPYYKDDCIIEWTRWECRPWFEADGTIGGIILYTEVISERKKLEEDLIHKNMELEASEEEIRAANEELFKIYEALSETNIELQKAKENAEESARHLMLLIEHAPEAIFIQSGFKFTYLNQQALMLFGASNKEQLLDMPVLDRFDPSRHEQVREQINNLFHNTKPRVSLEQTIVRLDGNILFVEISGVPFLHEDKESALVFVRNITERKIFEEKLQKSYDLLNNLAAHVPGVVYQYRLYPDGKSAFPYSSPGMFEIYEVTSEEVRDDASKVFTRLHPDDINSISAKILESAQNQTLFYSEFRVILPKQGLRWRQCEAKPQRLNDGSTLWHGIIVDITDRKNAEEKLKEQQLLFETMFNTITDGVIITNTHREILHANKGIELTFGYKPEEIIGKSTEILYANNQNFHNTGESVFNENSISSDNIYMTHYKDKSGKVFPGETFGAKLYDSDGAWIGNLAIMRNISERVKYIEELKIARQKAEESDHLKTAFLHNISHEIRTPMNAIIGFSEFLQNPNIAHERRIKFTDVIIQSSNQLLSIINDIVNIATIEAGQVKLDLKEVSLNGTLQLLYQQFKLKSIDQNISLECIAPLSDSESIIIADGTKLIEILSNLIGNAFKFTSKGHVNFGYVVRENILEFFVQDTGIGIPKEMHNEIFNRFRQVESSMTRRYGGSGLGLSISKAYVELMGGCIWLTSEPDKGSTFFFNIPYNKAKKENGQVGTGNFISNKDSISKTILIAEDDEANFFLLEEIFSKFNFKLIRAYNGVEAFNHCKHNLTIDLVLMDMKMPVMDGFEATKKIKEIRPKLPIIAQTAYSNNSDIARALSCGCSDTITKPIVKEILINKINELILT